MTFARSLLLLAGLTCTTVGASGCFTTGGMLYENTIHPMQATMHKVGAKRGEACSQTYLGLIALGDGGIAAAAKKGGIREVATVDHRTTNVLGLFREHCSIVTGD